MDKRDVAEFARTFRGFLEAMHDLAGTGDDAGEPLPAALAEHLGRSPRGLPVVTARFAAFEQVNIQVALDALLDQPDRSYSLVGLLGEHHAHMSFVDLVQISHRRGITLGAVDYVSLADGFDSVRPCVQAGLYRLRDNDVPVVILVRGVVPHSGRDNVTVEILAEERAHGERLLAELRRLSLERSVFRKQVLTFAASPFGEQTAGPIAFERRPQLSSADVILPVSTLTAVEEHVFGIAEHRQRLLDSGQHIKRGLLLHGPPGTGKTLTTRYLIGRLVDHTVVVLSGPALEYVGAAAKLARSLQPALLVLEDVDLVANERRHGLGHASPVLFELLNVMDGLDEDADLIFLLTTNRADVLEPALAARPGRVDQAVEIGLPDEDSRRRLLELYGAGVDLPVSDLADVVARTEGVTASFIKELVRKAALLAAESEKEGTGRLTVTDDHLNQALDRLLDEGASLTRALLGIQRGDQPEPPDGDDPAAASAFFASLSHSRHHRSHLSFGD